MPERAAEPGCPNASVCARRVGRGGLVPWPRSTPQIWTRWLRNSPTRPWPSATRGRGGPSHGRTDVDVHRTRGALPGREVGDDFVVLLPMADIQYVNKHHDVEQGTKYLGSNRPAIPLGLDGPEHRSTGGCSTRVHSQARRAAGRAGPRARGRDDRRFVEDGEVRCVRAPGASRSRRRCSSRSWACRWRISTNSSGSRTWSSATSARAGSDESEGAAPGGRRGGSTSTSTALDGRAARRRTADDMLGGCPAPRSTGSASPGTTSSTSLGC